MNVADIRELFAGLQDTTYFNTANMAVGCTPAREAYERAVAKWSTGWFDWMDGERAGEVARETFAWIVGAQADEVALVPTVSTAAGLVAANLPPAKRGENVVVAGSEFSSNLFPWLMLRERGYDVRLVGADGLSTDAYADAADGGTRLIAASAVQSSTGYRTDLAALSQVAARSGAWFFVDASQAAGAIPLDVVRDGVDFLAAASYKFLLGSRGVGYLFVRRQLLDAIRPVFPGWKAARHPLESFYGPGMELSSTASKLDTSLAWFTALAEEASLGVFRRFGIDALVNRNAQLSQRLHDALVAHCPAFRPHPERNRSTVISFPVDDPAAVIARLKAAKVVASARAGRVRLSVHFYNTEQEIDRVAELLGNT